MFGKKQKLNHMISMTTDTLNCNSCPGSIQCERTSFLASVFCKLSRQENISGNLWIINKNQSERSQREWIMLSLETSGQYEAQSFLENFGSLQNVVGNLDMIIKGLMWFRQSLLFSSSLKKKKGSSTLKEAAPWVIIEKLQEIQRYISEGCQWG